MTDSGHDSGPQTHTPTKGTEGAGAAWLVTRAALRELLNTGLLMHAVNRDTLHVPNGVALAADGAEIRRRLVDGIVAQLEAERVTHAQPVGPLNQIADDLGIDRATFVDRLAALTDPALEPPWEVAWRRNYNRQKRAEEEADRLRAAGIDTGHDNPEPPPDVVRGGGFLCGAPSPTGEYECTKPAGHPRSAPNEHRHMGADGTSASWADVKPELTPSAQATIAELEAVLRASLAATPTGNASPAFTHTFTPGPAEPEPDPASTAAAELRTAGYFARAGAYASGFDDGWAGAIASARAELALHGHHRARRRLGKLYRPPSTTGGFVIPRAMADHLAVAVTETSTPGADR